MEIDEKYQEVGLAGSARPRRSLPPSGRSCVPQGTVDRFYTTGRRLGRLQRTAIYDRIPRYEPENCYTSKENPRRNKLFSGDSFPNLRLGYTGQVPGQDPRRRSFSSDSVQGKVVSVQFWATWCRYCRSDEPVVDDLLQEFRKQGLLVLAVDVAESKKTVTKYLAESPRHCKIVLMNDTNLAAWFDPKSFPHYAVIGRNGSLAGEQEGAGGESSLRHLCAKPASAQRAPTIPAN